MRASWGDEVEEDYSEVGGRLTAPLGGATYEACTLPPINPRTHYVVVRSDLPLGLLAANVCHAAGESSPGDLDSGTFAVVLAARDEPELLSVERRLSKAGIAHASIRETDGPLAGQLCAIGVVPVEDRAPVRRVLSYLPLLGREAIKK